jgi:radical SAM protein with 4Fe4S-binding SPASM domain
MGKARLLIREAEHALSWCSRDRAFLPRPVEASLFLTRTCNSRCSMCDNWRHKATGSELSIEEIERVLDELNKMGVAVISLSAEGEITTRPDFPQIVAAVARRGFIFSINTNGLHLSEEAAQAIIAARPYSVIIGIDTQDADRYWTLRGISDGVERVNGSIRRLRDKDWRAIALGAIVFDTNLDDLIALTQWAKDEGLQAIRFTAVQSRGFGKAWDSSQSAPYREDGYQARLKETIEHLIRMKHHAYPISSSSAYLRMIPSSYSQNGYFPASCRTPWRRIHIHPQGEVSLCQVVGEGAMIGNVREQSIPAIWSSEKARRFRSLVARKGCGGCWLSCYAETNLAYAFPYAIEAMGNRIRRAVQLLMPTKKK